MYSHLTLPYNWVDCVNPETCQEYIHLTDTAENLNNYPLEWVKQLLPAECTDEEGTITLYNAHKQKHHETGPAVEKADGSLQWWLNGEPHREDGPAKIWADSTTEWYMNGKLHREDGPAFIDVETREWYHHGEIHREDGPAIENADGTEHWFINGEPINTSKSFKQNIFRTRTTNMRASFSQRHKRKTKTNKIQ